MVDVDPLVALARIRRSLDALDVPFAIVGGIAVSVRAEVRATRDLDLAVALEQQRLEEVVHTLRGEGYWFDGEFENMVTGETATIRLLADGMLIDLLAASSGVEAEIVANATIVDLEPVGRVAVATAADLLALKTLAWSEARPQDLLDARALLRTNPDIDLDRTRWLLRLIAARGCERGVDLIGRLESWLREVRG